MTHHALRQTEHRPWPLPLDPWCGAMCWHDLLFAHWPVEAERLRRLLPAGLELDLFEGRAWLGIVPFGMRGVRPRFVPPVPYLSAFPELNVRTYVTVEGRPGVWFFSLDAARMLAVRTARLIHLPYFDASMELRCGNDNWIHYRSRRTHRGAPAAMFEARYRPTSEVYNTQPGDLDHWLTHRYALYTADQRGRLARLEVHHAPWPLQIAEAELATNTMWRQIDVELPDDPPLLHFSRSLDVIAWWPEPVGRPSNNA